MKKLMIYSMLVAGVALASCDEVEEMTGKPQVNPEIPGYDISKLQISSPLGDAVDLPALNVAGTKEVAVMEVSDPGNLPEGYILSSTYQLSASEDFADPYSVEVTFPESSSTGFLTASELENAYEALLGLKSDPAEFYGRAEVFAKNGKGSVIRLGGDDVYYASAAFTLTPDPAFVLYTPGDSNGWDGGASMQLPSNDGKSYQGFAYLSGSFKFTTAPGWDGTNYGAGASEGELSTDGGAGNLSVPEAGLYWVDVDTSDLTYTLTNIASLGVIGSFNGWGGDEPMTHNEAWNIWSAQVDFTGDGEWKIRANNNWDISFGTSLENMTFNGGNLPDPGAGTYTVTFDLSKVPYTVSCVPAGI